MLPRPAAFKEYPEHVQARMMAWNDAWTIDESRRQDKLVDAEVDQARTGRKIAVGLALFCFISAIVFFALGNTVAGVAFLAVPVLETATSFLSSVFSQSSRHEEPPAPRTKDDGQPPQPAS